MIAGFHSGGHTNAYHIQVQNIHDKAYQGKAGNGQQAAQNALKEAQQNILIGIGQGSIMLYNTREVWLH